MISTETVAPDSLTETDRQSMFRLMRNYYENVDYDDFVRDMSRKDSVIVLRSDKCLCGFSTQALWESAYNDQQAKVIFSGDTIVDETCRASTALPFAFARFLLSIYQDNPQTPLYWLLTSKGYKTYHAMTAFFYRYFPSPDDAVDPYDQGILAGVVKSRFNGRLDRERWVLRAEDTSQKLRHGAGTNQACRRKPANLRFYEEKNPGHAAGDELICFARFHEENIKRSIWKRLTEL